MPLKSAPLTQAAVRRMIKESIDAAIAAEWERQANDGYNASRSGQARGQVTASFVRECTFAGFMKCNPDNLCDKKVKFAAATLRGHVLTWWNSKVAILGLDVANQIGWIEMKKLTRIEFCPAEELQRMENELWNLKPETVKIDAYIRGLSVNIKGEVTSSRPTNLNEVVRMAHKLMEQKLQARNERILEGNKQKWENFQSGNSSGKSNNYDNSRQSSQNNQKQGNAQAMTTSPNEGKCLLDHFLYVNIVLLALLVNVRSSAKSVKRLGTKRGIARKRMLPRVQKLNPSGLVIILESKDAKPQGLNVVTGTFLLNNRYASVLSDLGSDRSFVDTRFSSMLDINPIKIATNYEVEFGDVRIVSTDTILKGCTLNLVNHLFEIDLMTVELAGHLLPPVSRHLRPPAATGKVFRRAIRPKPKTILITRSIRSPTPLSHTRHHHLSRHQPPLPSLHHHRHCRPISIYTPLLPSSTPPPNPPHPPLSPTPSPPPQPPPPSMPPLHKTTTIYTSPSTVEPPQHHHNHHAAIMAAAVSSKRGVLFFWLVRSQQMVRLVLGFKHDGFGFGVNSPKGVFVSRDSSPKQVSTNGCVWLDNFAIRVRLRQQRT
nr:hypothetical protein [Tanacetum cinerariifolium]